MNGPYLKKLRALRSQKGILEAPSKPSKRSPSAAVAPTATAIGGFDGFEGARSSRFPDLLGRYGRVVAAFEAGCPDLVPAERWRQAVEDGHAFLARWADQAEALGWSPRDLFGLHKPPAKPHPSYSRLSRYDETGLVWLLQGREVVALTADTASIKGATGNITIYRKHNKPTLGLPAAGSVTEDYLRSRGLDLPVGLEQMAGEDFAAVFEKLGTDWRSGITINRGTA